MSCQAESAESLVQTLVGTAAAAAALCRIMFDTDMQDFLAYHTSGKIILTVCVNVKEHTVGGGLGEVGAMLQLVMDFCMLSTLVLASKYYSFFPLWKLRTFNSFFCLKCSHRLTFCSSSNVLGLREGPSPQRIHQLCGVSSVDLHGPVPGATGQQFAR